MDFEIPAEITATLAEIDAFIEAEIRPLEQQDDNIRFFDHRREYSRTDFEAGGVPRADWEDLLREMRRRADAAGWLRWALPAEYGGHGAGSRRSSVSTSRTRVSGCTTTCRTRARSSATSPPC
jgi:acyl-CoA dehydrogenase